MPDHKKWIKILVIVLMITGVIGLHYLTAPEMRYQHAVYRMLFTSLLFWVASGSG